MSVTYGFGDSTNGFINSVNTHDRTHIHTSTFFKLVIVVTLLIIKSLRNIAYTHSSLPSGVKDGGSIQKES